MTWWIDREQRVQNEVSRKRCEERGRTRERERKNVLRFARIYFVFCCCLRKQTAGPWPNVGPSKQGLPRSLPYAYPGPTVRFPSPPQSRVIVPSPSPTLSELFSLFISNHRRCTPKPISSEAPRSTLLRV